MDKIFVSWSYFKQILKYFFLNFGAFSFFLTIIDNEFLCGDNHIFKQSLLYATFMAIFVKIVPMIAKAFKKKKETN